MPLASPQEVPGVGILTTVRPPKSLRSTFEPDVCPLIKTFHSITRLVKNHLLISASEIGFSSEATCVINSFLQFKQRQRYWTCVAFTRSSHSTFTALLSTFLLMPVRDRCHVDLLF